MTSGRADCTQSRNWVWRARMPLTFQVAIFTEGNYRAPSWSTQGRRKCPGDLDPRESQVKEIVAMKMGISLPQFGQYASPENIVQVAREAERIGCASVWVQERLLRP